ncbi:epidermal retinol dehydrogenase 2-like isoform X2 [Homarus americanus]|uniref:epidermal retinol dehydrogenase 2-like isoform X2 n=1 Tax=Homarus americanus TaxID=6706 RepID=UPI001C45795A|nr:epidermal retinol dehydrogenase 2-like isoform X2 [Homarus americanus]
MSFLDFIKVFFEVLGAILSSIYYALESLVISLVPRKFKRKDVEGQVVLVTGGGSGIGRLVCLKLAARGAKIVTWDVNTAGNEETAKLVVAAGGEGHAYSVDLCDRHAIYATATKVKQEVGKVDILVNNAGIVTGRNFIDAPDHLIQKTFDVNIMSHFWTTKAFLGDMLASNRGHVVTVASLAGLGGVNKLADYCASKFAAVGFDESLRIELQVEGYTGVKTTAVCPYYISTGMFDGVKSKVIPILKPEYVASEIVDGILLNTPIVVLPPFCKYLVLLKYCLPQKAYVLLGRVTGITCALDELVGHKNFN